MFLKIGVLKHFANFTGKQPQQDLFNNAEGLGPAT